MDEVQIGPVRNAADLAAVADLFRTYAASLDVDLAFQDFEEELAGMPGKYARPKGALLLARGSDGAPVGYVGLRPMHAAGCCEMKRLFVTPEGRGVGLGGQLVAALVEIAEQIGYCEMRLDTLPTMAGAQALYRKFEFDIIAPYYQTPIAGTIFMRRVLSPAKMARPGSGPSR